MNPFSVYRVHDLHSERNKDQRLYCKCLLTVCTRSFFVAFYKHASINIGGMTTEIVLYISLFKQKHIFCSLSLFNSLKNFGLLIQIRPNIITWTVLYFFRSLF